VTRATAAPQDAAATGGYLFSDDIDGPAGSGPDPGRWTVQNWDDPVVPPMLGHYRDDRRNVFLDGNSNLVLMATREDGQYYSGKVLSNFRGMMGTTWEARVKLDCLSPGNWPAVWLLNADPLPDGEVDLMEWYGNGLWRPGSTVHAVSDGKTWKGRDIPELVDNGWHNWRVNWGADKFQFWRDYTEGARPYLTVPAGPINGRWPFNDPGYWLQMILNLAVGGPGGGNPDGGSFPSTMTIDWVRVW
jgi:hypothetical protein